MSDISNARRDQRRGEGIMAHTWDQAADLQPHRARTVGTAEHRSRLDLHGGPCRWPPRRRRDRPSHRWFPLVLVGLSGIAALILVALPLTTQPVTGVITRWADAPPAALLSLVGAFTAPIHPPLHSALVSATAPARHSKLVGLIVVASAHGGTTGPCVIGRASSLLDPAHAFCCWCRSPDWARRSSGCA